MTEHNQTSQHTSRIPPVAGESRGIGMVLPTLLSIAGGLAALWLLENQTGAVSRTARQARGKAEDLWEHAGKWAHDLYESAGDHARDYSQHARRSLRSARDSAGETAADLREGLGERFMHAAEGAAGLLAALRSMGFSAEEARSAARRGARRVRQQYRSLREREPEPRDWGFTEAAFLGLTAAGIGAAAAYVMSSQTGQRYRREIGQRAREASRRAGHWTTQAAHSARELADSAAESISGRFRGEAPEVADEELVSRVRSRLAEVMSNDMGELRVSATHGQVTITGRLPQERRDELLEAARGVKGVRGVEHETKQGR